MLGLVGATDVSINRINDVRTVSKNSNSIPMSLIIIYLGVLNKGAC